MWFVPQCSTYKFIISKHNFSRLLTKLLHSSSNGLFTKNFPNVVLNDGYGIRRLSSLGYVIVRGVMDNIDVKLLWDKKITFFIVRDVID